MSDKWRRQAEVLTAVLISLWIAALHVLNLLRAGPLWRDEVGTVDFAAMPVGDIWKNLRYDNFPPLFAAVARVWTLAGLNSDFAYRVLGFLIGIGTLALLWWCARQMGAATPLLALALYAANPVAIRVGDSLRPYGLGIALTLLTMTLVWNFAQKPRWSSLAWASLAATLSVQCFYPNAFFIAAFSGGAWAVTLSRREWKAAGQTALIGLAAALSLLPYAGIIKAGQDWSVILKQKVNFEMIWNSLGGVLRAPGPWMVLVWGAALMMALIVAVLYGTGERRRNLVYCITVLLAGTALHLAFLRWLEMPPRLWYFLVLMAPIALLFDSILGVVAAGPLQLGRIVLAVFVVLAGVPATCAKVSVRQSNIDLVAAKLMESVQPGDAVVVSPWYYGVALQRYWDASHWTTLPPMPVLAIHRYDLLKEAMMAKDPIGPLLEKARAALRGGHRLWLVGVFREPPGGRPPPALPPYQESMKEGEGAYCTQWELQMTAMVKEHADRGQRVVIPIPGQEAVNPFEDVRVALIEGWKQ